jgi:hypothetical protein
MGKLSLYLIGVYGLIGAAVVFMRRQNQLRNPPVHRLAAQLQAAWADHHTRA